MFMMDKSLIIIIFMYSAGFAFLGVQYIIGDVFGVTMTTPSGVEVKSNLLQALHVSNMEQFQNSLNTTGSYCNVLSLGCVFNTANYLVVAGNVGWDILLLSTGLYVFNILYLFGVPLIFIFAFIILYIIFVARAIIGWIRGL